MANMIITVTKIMSVTEIMSTQGQKRCRGFDMIAHAL